MHDINSSTEATKLVGDLMQWTGEQNIHIQTVLHLNKGDDNARGHIGTELNNKAESVLLIARDNADADRSIVSPAIIRSKAFQPFAFRLSEDEGICLPKLDSHYTELGYGDLLAQLSSTLLWLVIPTARRSSKSSFAFSSTKE